jgi:hypothetical protein
MTIAKKHALFAKRACFVPAALDQPPRWRRLTAMLLSGLLLVPLLALSQASSATSAPKTTAYARPHTATKPGKNGKKTTAAKDYLKITTLSPTEISFCLDTSGKNGSMCNLWGKASRGEGQKYTFRSGAGDQECVLELTLTRDAWIVHDVTGACARQSCGAGAGVGEAKFLLRDRVQKVHPCESEAAGSTDN